jgi:hypothetical protein
VTNIVVGVARMAMPIGISRSFGSYFIAKREKNKA